MPPRPFVAEVDVPVGVPVDRSVDVPVGVPVDRSVDVPVDMAVEGAASSTGRSVAVFVGGAAAMQLSYI
jgi:hypothetical protein